MSSYITNPHIQFLDEDGKPLAYGTVETYIAGTTKEYATMKDFNGTMNPSKIVLDDDGSCCIILPNDQLIKMVIRTREGRLFKTYDNVGAGAGGSGEGGGDYYGSDFIAIDQIARVISLKNYKYITTDNTLIMDEDAYKITLKVNPEIIDVNKTIEGKAGINVEENEDKIVLSLDGNNIDITSDNIEVTSEYDEETGVKTFNLECDIPEPIDAYTKEESDAKYQEKGNYVTKDELQDYALKSEIPDINNLASIDYVDGEIDRSNAYTVELTDALDTRVTNVEDALDEKQDTLVSGTNIKTINGNSLLGSGNIEVGGSISPSNVKVTKTISLPGGNVSEGVFDTNYSIPANKTFIGQVVINTLPATGPEFIRLGVVVGSYDCWFADGFLRATTRYTAWALPFSYANGNSANNIKVRIEGNLPEGNVDVTISGVLI